MRLLCLVLLAAAPAHAESAGQWRGAEHIWASSCTYCHDTGVGPHLRGTRPDPKLVAAVVRNGLPGMPAFHPSEISDEDLAALGTWLQRQAAAEKRK